MNISHFFILVICIISLSSCADTSKKPPTDNYFYYPTYHSNYYNPPHFDSTYYVGPYPGYFGYYNYSGNWTQ